MSLAVQIRVLGEFSVAVDDAAVGGLHSARLQSLLAYLLLNRTTPQSRQQLAFLFWPETSDGQAQTNLRQLLHTLRRRLPALADALLVDERTIRWRADAPLQLDVAEFEAALARQASYRQRAAQGSRRGRRGLSRPAGARLLRRLDPA